MGDEDSGMEMDESGGEEEKPKKVSSIKETEEEANERRRKKKEKLKRMFDAEYDETNEFYNSLKEEFDQQAKVGLQTLD